MAELIVSVVIALVLLGVWLGAMTLDASRRVERQLELARRQTKSLEDEIRELLDSVQR